MLNLLVNTSTWLDLAKRRDGQKWIVAIRVLRHQGQLELLVPAVVMEEFGRNRPRIEQSMTESVAHRFRLIKRDLDDYGGLGHQEARRMLDGLAHHVPMIGAMTTRNFDDIAELLRGGRTREPTDHDRLGVVQRGLDKRAPFHRSRNSVADALLIELYSSAIALADLSTDEYAFVTSNSEDFSDPTGDRRIPHPDLEGLFVSDGSTYRLGVEGLDETLRRYVGEEYDELLEESDFLEEPRRLDEILAAEQEFFDRVWYHRSLQRQITLERDQHPEDVEELLRVSGPARRRVEAAYPDSGQLGPYSDFELGMLNGKLSALRWVLGSEWDFLDT